VSIAAVNRAGPGEFSVIIHFTRELGWNVLVSACVVLSFTCTLAVPSMPQNVNVTRLSATVMVVSWIPLSYSEAKGFISHYTVAYFPIAKNTQTLGGTTQTVPGMDANTARIEGLDANTDYIIQVSATNGAGTSELSALHLSSFDIEST
jgi:hypothetical protein